MKKTLFLLLFAVLLTGCGKDDEPTKVADLNVKQLVDYIGKSAEYVKSNFKDGEFIIEGGTLGKTKLSYFFTTPEVRYSVDFKTDTHGIVNKIAVYGSFPTYKQGVESYKTEMDKINSTIKHYTYSAYFNSKSAGLIAFSDRSKFWQYVAEKDVSTFVWEQWGLSDASLTSFSIKGEYSRSNNSISIDIEYKEW